MKKAPAFTVDASSTILILLLFFDRDNQFSFFTVHIYFLSRLKSEFSQPLTFNEQGRGRFAPAVMPSILKRIFSVIFHVAIPPFLVLLYWTYSITRIDIIYHASSCTNRLLSCHLFPIQKTSRPLLS